MNSLKNILIAFILNLFFSIFEFWGGFFTNSVAIMSDALHDLGDSLTIGISYLLEKKSRQAEDHKYTFGYVRYSVLGSLITTIILIVGSIIMICGAISRIFNPVKLNYNGMIVFAIIGVIVNLLAAYFTRDGESLNQKSVNLHMLEDVLGWIIVLIGSVAMKFMDITIIDSILSIGVALFIMFNAFKNLASSIEIFLEKTPSNIDIDLICSELEQIKGISNVHHVHVWSIDGFNSYATLHVVSKTHSKRLKEEIRSKLKEHGINHVTIEFDNRKDECLEFECTKIECKHTHHHHH